MLEIPCCGSYRGYSNFCHEYDIYTWDNVYKGTPGLLEVRKNSKLFLNQALVSIMCNEDYQTLHIPLAKLVIQGFKLANRGSYMSAHVLLNLLNELGKRDKMRGLPSILSLFRNEFNKFNNTRAQMLDSIYHMTNTLKSYFWRKNVIILSLCTQRCYGRHSVSR